MLVLIATVIVAGTLWYTQGLVSELREAEQRTIRFYANTLQTLLNSPQENTWGSEVASDLALQAADILYFPVIVTDAQGNIMRGATADDGATEWVIMNVDIDSSDSPDQQERDLKERVDDMSKTYDALPVYAVTQIQEEVSIGDSIVTQSISDTLITNYIYFDDSEAVEQLQLLPWIEIIIISMFVLIGYISFSHIKRSEQSNIWVGMAKETAHQLGTPLSSLMGWIELIRYAPDNRDQVLESADEMSRDIDRLNTVAQRFSKIGSATQTTVVDLNGVVDQVVHYFDRRLPHLGKRVDIRFEPSPDPAWSSINVDLFQWVLENLVRNSADAIDRQEGIIRLSIVQTKSYVTIEVADNGKGIDPKIRKDIFRPGFSTKQRGWGLGLSLAKRIVEEYHGGRISIRETSPEGTVFSIRLRREAAPDKAQQKPTKESNVHISDE